MQSATVGIVDRPRDTEDAAAIVRNLKIELGTLKLIPRPLAGIRDRNRAVRSAREILLCALDGRSFPQRDIRLVCSVMCRTLSKAVALHRYTLDLCRLRNSRKVE